jgi:hypothetical protein
MILKNYLNFYENLKKGAENLGSRAGSVDSFMSLR